MKRSLATAGVIMSAHDMDSIKLALNQLRHSQQNVEMKLEAFFAHDIMQENTTLKQSVETLRLQLRESSAKLEAAKRDHTELAAKFKHELHTKRMAVLALTERQHRTYLDAGLQKQRIEINKIHDEMIQITIDMQKEINALDQEERAPILAELQTLRTRISAQVQSSHERRQAAWFSATNHQHNKLKEVQKMPIDDAAMNAIRRFFAWETFFGLKVISVVGAFLILLGAFTFGVNFFTGMGPGMQNATIFMLGIALMGGGEFFYRKKWRGGFTLALTSGGSAVLFTGAALGYMTLGVLPMWAALAIFAAVSLLSFAAALRYDAQLIAAFALMGGFMPMGVLSESAALFGTLYLTLLGLLTLAITTHKQWRVVRFMGLGMGLIALMILSALSNASSLENVGLIRIVLGIAIALHYLAYFTVPIFIIWLKRIPLRTSDIVLLIGNVVIHYLIALAWMGATVRLLLLTSHFANMWLVIVTVFFAVSFIVMACVVERKVGSDIPESETSALRMLFFFISIAFITLAVFIGFNSAWLSMGLLIQSLALLLYGLIRRRVRFTAAGTIIGLICLFVFLMFNVPHGYEWHFRWQYLAITSSALLISALIWKVKPTDTSLSSFVEIFRAVTVMNAWVFIIYLLHSPLAPLLTRHMGEHAPTMAAVVCILLGFVVAFVLPRVRRVHQHGYLAAAIIVGVVASTWLTVFNTNTVAVANHLGMRVALVALYIIVNITAVGWFNDLLRFLCGLRKLSLDWYPLILSVGTMLLATQNLVVQFSLGASSWILTLFFALVALGWVVFGFIKRNVQIRISGLGLVFFAVFKLFLLDLRGLQTTERIVTFFIGGFILLGISFAYQWFNKRLATTDEQPSVLHD